MAPPNTVTFEMMLAIGVVLFVLYWPWQHLMIEKARQRLFRIRDEIFDKAAKGELDFESVAYRQTVRQINQFIRYCHTLSWPRVLVGHFYVTQTVEPKPILDQAPNEDLKAFLKGRMTEVGLTLGWLIFHRSPLLMLLSIPFWIYQTNFVKKIVSMLGGRAEREVLLYEGEYIMDSENRAAKA